LYGIFVHADILDTLKTVHVPLFQIITLYGVFVHADILDTLKTVHVPLFQIISLHGMYIHNNTCRHLGGYV
jgi:hypothetical protein